MPVKKDLAGLVRNLHGGALPSTREVLVENIIQIFNDESLQSDLPAILQYDQNKKPRLRLRFNWQGSAVNQGTMGVPGYCSSDSDDVMKRKVFTTFADWLWDNCIAEARPQVQSSSSNTTSLPLESIGMQALLSACESTASHCGASSSAGTSSSCRAVIAQQQQALRDVHKLINTLSTVAEQLTISVRSLQALQPQVKLQDYEL